MKTTTITYKSDDFNNIPLSDLWEDHDHIVYFEKYNLVVAYNLPLDKTWFTVRYGSEYISENGEMAINYIIDSRLE